MQVQVVQEGEGGAGVGAGGAGVGEGGAGVGEGVAEVVKLALFALAVLPLGGQHTE